jgi:geranylgeranyl transferase type-2 subunit alpha
VVKNGNLSRLGELDFTYEKICSNFSNYSSWHYRSKLIETLYYENQIDADIFKKELALIENATFTDPNDQSSWIYEKWLLQEHQRSHIKELSFDIETSRLRFKFAQETNLNTNLVHLKLNDIFISFDEKNPDVNFKWVSELGEPDGQSLIWQEKLLNITDSPTNEKIKFLMNSLLAEQNYLRVEIIVRNSGVSNDFLLERSPNEKSMFEFKSKFDMKDIRLDQDLVESHLKNVIELSKMELDKSKWCLLTTIELMSINNFAKYKTVIFENLDKLANEIDPYRRNFYLDLKQRIIKNNS